MQNQQSSSIEDEAEPGERGAALVDEWGAWRGRFRASHSQCAADRTAQHDEADNMNMYSRTAGWNFEMTIPWPSNDPRNRSPTNISHPSSSSLIHRKGYLKRLRVFETLPPDPRAIDAQALTIFGNHVLFSTLSIRFCPQIRHKSMGHRSCRYRNSRLFQPGK